MRVGGLLSRAARAIAAEAHDVRCLFGSRGSRFGVDDLAPGLRTYRVERHGGRTRLHLRVGADGTGTLFVDVTEAVHLSRTATEMAWLALEKASEAEAAGRLLRRYSRVGRRELARHYRRMQGVIERLSDPRHSCRTCLLDLPRTPLFSRETTAPYKVDLALTYACNNGCPHCYNEPDRFDLPPLDVPAWRRVIDTLAEAGVPHLIFTGGEPTLHPGLPEIISHAESRGQICGLNTNGRRLADRSFLRELVSAGLDHVQITLHSHDRLVHDAMVGARAFDETLEGLEAAIESGIHVITNTTLTRASAPGAMRTVRFLHSLGLRRFAMNAMIHAGGGESSPDALPTDRLAAVLVGVREIAAELDMRFLWYSVTEYCKLSPIELEIGAKRCNAAEYSMCIEPSGDVLPCQSYYRAAGNILHDPWESFWDSSLFRSFRDRESRPAAGCLSDDCVKCPDLSVCGGGCRLEREARERAGGAGSRKHDFRISDAAALARVGSHGHSFRCGRRSAEAYESHSHRQGRAPTIVPSTAHPLSEAPMLTASSASDFVARVANPETLKGNSNAD